MKNSGMDDIRQFFRLIGEQIGEGIGESMVEAVRDSLPKLRQEISNGVPARRTAAERRGAKVSLSLTRDCPVPGCGRPGRGPRYSFLCEVHREMSAEEREKYRIRPRRT